MNKGDALLIELDYTVNGEALQEGEWDDIEFALNDKSYSLSNGDIYWDGEAYVVYLGEADTFDLRFTNIYQLRLAKDGYVISSPITTWRVGGVLSKKYLTGDITTSRYDELIERTITSINSNASKVGYGAFQKCTQLKTATFPEATTIEDHAFEDCASLEYVDIPKVTAIGADAFARAQYDMHIKKINAPLLETIAEYGFYLSGLEELNAPNVRRIGLNAFSECNIEEAMFPNYDVAQLGEGAFNNCTKLEVADLGMCSQILTNAFVNCTNLNTLILRSTSIVRIEIEPTWFNNTKFKTEGGEIYVPQALITRYEADLMRWAYVKGLNANNTFRAIEGSIYE